MQIRFCWINWEVVSPLHGKLQLTRRNRNEKQTKRIMKIGIGNKNVDTISKNSSNEWRYSHVQIKLEHSYPMITFGMMRCDLHYLCNSTKTTPWRHTWHQEEYLSDTPQKTRRYLKWNFPVFWRILLFTTTEIPQVAYIFWDLQNHLVAIVINE